LGLQAIGICSLHLLNVCIKKNADSNSSLQQQQQQQQQILYLLIHNTVFQLGFQKGRVLVLKKGSLVRCWIFKKGIFLGTL
jgi:hypothetical protein